MRTQYNPNTGTKLGKCKKKIPIGYTKVQTITAIINGKKILINQVMLSKIWYLVYVEEPLMDIIQNIKKYMHDFLCNY